MGQVTARHRRQVEERDGGCVAAGQLPGRCWGHLDMGHIIGRGAGGGSLYDTPGWLTLQCRFHNGQIEDGQGPLAERLGLKIRRNSTALIPERPLVRYPDGHWYYLNHDDPATKERMAGNENEWQARAERVPTDTRDGAARADVRPVRHAWE